MPHPNNILTAALGYAGRGWAVFPLVPGWKTPLTAHGFLDATKKRSQIIAWWKSTPNANIGIATGAVSGIIVVDVDDLRGLRDLKQLTGDTSTLTSRTQSGGLHLIYEHPGVRVGNRQNFISGVDLRGDGGYIVAPPSVVNGNPYRFTSSGSPKAMPAELSAFLTGHHETTTGKNTRPTKAVKIVCDETDDLAHRGTLLMATMARLGSNKCKSPKPMEIIATRKKHGLTQTAAAALVCTTCRVWQQWEAGDRKMHPGFWTLFSRCVKHVPA